MKQRQRRAAANRSTTNWAKARWPRAPWKMRKYLDAAVTELAAAMDRDIMAVQ